MYRNLVPILAVFIISGGIQQAYAADYQPAHQQQAESECVVCHHHENLDDALFLVCNDHLLVVHNECIQAFVDSGNLCCPICSRQLSEENVHLALSRLTSGDVVPHVSEGPVVQDGVSTAQIYETNENYSRCFVCSQKMNNVDMVWYALCELHGRRYGMHKGCKQRIQEELRPTWIGCIECEFNSPY